MRKIKILAIGLVISVFLVGCSKNNTTDQTVKETDKKVEETTTEKPTTAVTPETTSTLSKEDKEDLIDLLEDTGELSDVELNDEIELVDLAESWVTDLKEITFDIPGIEEVTREWLETAREKKVERFKEAFPKLDYYAVGLLQENPEVLELYKKTDSDNNEVLDDPTVTEDEWIAVYQAIMDVIK